METTFETLVEKFFGFNALNQNYNNVGLSNIEQDDDKYSIEIIVPGLTKDDINLEIDGNYLNITSNKKESKSILTSNLNKQYKLNDKIDTDNINATLENGILKIELYKKESKKPRQIKIK